ncbi:hypothetical protein UCDDS831_g00898 [Diplodia seriata]|uniref:Uncharacterized protein n=1 Tax=Diplodia seriata TaxID=420778 RepID=A0A0G2GV71_9PEZI|nr:hypothetical protein UCDDS831_g00898 [Diplodia seriata]
MASQDHTPEPTDAPLALKLHPGCSFSCEIFQLNLPSNLGISIEVITFDSERTLTLACNAPIHHLSRTVPSTTYHYQKLNLVAALRCGLLELVEQDTQAIVHLPPAKEEPGGGHVNIPPRENPRDRQHSMTLYYDSTAPIWKSVLQLHKTYNLRLSASGGEVWCHDPSSPDQRLPVRREPSTAPAFTVYADPLPPSCTATLTVEPRVCHRSGTPPFKFVTEITLDASAASDGPVTVDMYNTPFDSGDLNDACGLTNSFGGLNSVSQLVRCVDVGTGEEVEFSMLYLCWDSDPHPEFPEDRFFVELWPGRPWRHEYTLAKESNTDIGGLGCLRAGNRYKVDLAVPRLGPWMYGTKEDLLKGTTQENLERWEPGPRGRPPIPIRQVNAPVEFDVVE